MALKLKGAAAPTPPKDTHFDFREKNGVLTVRATTHDGKKFLIADLTPAGIKLRQRNFHPDLGIAVDRAGQVRLA